jgi:hypothetical protein
LLRESFNAQPRAPAFARPAGAFGWALNEERAVSRAIRLAPAGRSARYLRPRGLAPLELVIALPILLFVTALMVNFGTLATWRVRGEIVSRDAVWRGRWPRTGDWESRPRGWPANAGMGTVNGQQMEVLEHPDLQQPVVRGPLPNGFVVRDLLNPERGAREGQSSIVRRYPMLPRLGPYKSGSIEHPVLDFKWPCAEMGIPNIFRRTIRLYELPTTDQSLPSALAEACDAMFGMPNYLALYTLDRDADIKQFYGGYVDFHPRIRHPYQVFPVYVPYCQLDTEIVRKREVERLIDTLDARGRARLHRISRLPRRMTDFFLNMYRWASDNLKQEIETKTALLQDPGLSQEEKDELQAWITWAKSELQRIEPYVTALEAYQAKLPEIENQLRELIEP